MTTPAQSESSPASARRQQPGQRRLFGGLPPVVIVGGLAAVGAGIYFWWRRRSSASSQATSSASTNASSAVGVDYSGELSTIQTELEYLMANQGQQASSAVGSGTSTGTTSTGSTSTGSSTATGSGSTTSTTTAVKVPAMPTGVVSTGVTSSSVGLKWNESTGATSYRVRVTYQGALVGAAHNVSGTTINVSGLGADHTYTFHVAAVNSAGTSPETNGPAVKTSK